MKGRTNYNLLVFLAQPAAWAKGSYQAVLLTEATQSVKHAMRMPSASAGKVHVLPAVPTKDQICHNLPMFHVQPVAWAKGSCRAVLLVEATRSAKHATRMPLASAAKVRVLRVVSMQDLTNHNLPVLRVQRAAWVKGSYRAALSTEATQSAKLARRMLSASVGKVPAFGVASTKNRMSRGLFAFHAHLVLLVKGIYLRV